MSVNKCVLQGRLTRDVELRYTQSGKAVASFTVAWSETRNDMERKLFLPCTAWGKGAEFVEKHFSKGSEIIVEGTLATRQWEDRDGNKRETIEMNVDKMHFCGAKKESNPNAGYFREAPAADYDDQDLPF